MKKIRRAVLCSVCSTIQILYNNEKDKKCPICGHKLVPYKKDKEK